MFSPLDSLELRKAMIREQLASRLERGMIVPGTEERAGAEVLKSMSEPEIVKVGPEGYIHGWIKVGADSIGSHHSSDDEGSAAQRLGVTARGPWVMHKNRLIGFTGSNEVTGLPHDKSQPFDPHYISKEDFAEAEKNPAEGTPWYNGKKLGSTASKKEAIEAVARSHEAYLQAHGVPPEKYLKKPRAAKP